MESGELKSLLETIPVLSQNTCGALNASEAEIRSAARRRVRKSRGEQPGIRQNKTASSNVFAVRMIDCGCEDFNSPRWNSGARRQRLDRRGLGAAVYGKSSNHRGHGGARGKPKCVALRHPKSSAAAGQKRRGRDLAVKFLRPAAGDQHVARGASA